VHELSNLLAQTAGHFPCSNAFTVPGEGSVTYATLHGQVITVADFLRSQGVRAGERVAFCLPKSLASVAVLFGILEYRAAYVPLDVEAPVDRNQYILKNCEAAGFFAVREMASTLRAAFEEAVLIDEVPGLDVCWVRIQAKASALDIPQDLAYILYTSGSTGLPKGVLITHRNARCFVDWAGDLFQLSERDVLSSIAPFHFDLSVFDLFAGVRAGAQIVLMDAASAKNPMLLAGWIDEYRITVWYATPTTLKLMLRFGRLDRCEHTSLRLVLFAGEVFPLEGLRAIKERWKQVEFYNLYGPTETNVCTFQQIPEVIPAEQVRPYPIGRPCPYARAGLEQQGQVLEPVPGAEGELLITGESVMAGYLNLPDRNERAFLTDQQGTIWYHTGDLVRVNAEGALEYVSRIDRMVKRHGYRIELGEIEAALHRHPQIAACGVVHHPLADGDQRISAYFTTRSLETSLGVVELKTYLATALPPYMVPDKLVQLPELPQTSSHKVNYQVLQKME
jgi:amino acid adenylation domain-containing protein